MFKYNKNIYLDEKGITLLEIIVILVIMSGLFFVLISVFKNMNRRGELENAFNQAGFVLEKAKSMTLASKNDDIYGVHIENNAMILFGGGIYNSEDPNNEKFVFDEGVVISNIVLNGGGDNVIFKRLTGGTDFYGNFDIYMSSDTENKKTITITPVGLIQKN